MLPNQQDKYNITTNQSLTEDIMSDQVAVENKIHIQALRNPDPDFFDDSEEIKNIAELVEYYLTFQCKNFGDLYNDFAGDSVLLSQLHSIANDPNDDKLGRVRDAINKVISDMAYFVHCNYETNRWAKSIYDATIENVV